MVIKINGSWRPSHFVHVHVNKVPSQNQKTPLIRQKQLVDQIGFADLGPLLSCTYFREIRRALPVTYGRPQPFVDIKWGL